MIDCSNNSIEEQRVMKEVGTNNDSGNNNETMVIINSDIFFVISENHDILSKIFTCLPFKSLNKFKSVSKGIYRLIDELFISEIAQKLKQHPDIMFKIFTFLPPKDLYKFKCVSKGIRRLVEEPMLAVEHFQRLSAISPLTGFFYQRKYLLTCYSSSYCANRFCWKPAFVSTPYIDSKLLPDSSLEYLKVNKVHDVIDVFDSSDGLLLCRKFCYVTQRYTCYVHNPLTMEKVAFHSLREQTDRVKYALFAQTSSTGYIQYKVISVYKPKYGEPYSELVIFSSETGKWENMEVKLPPLYHDIKMGSKVVIKDVMFWDCLEGYILVYYFKKPKSGPSLDLIKSPKAQLTRCLWEYEGKLHCYCHGYDEHEEEEVPVWVLCRSNDGKLEWRKEDSEQFKNLAEDVWNGCHNLGKIFKQKAVPRVRFEILRYDPNLKTVYLFIDNAVFSYELIERKLEIMLGHYMNERVIPDNCALPYVHCMMPMEIGGKTDDEEDEQSIISSHESTTSIVAGIDEYYLDELISEYTDSANNVRSTGKKKKKSVRSNTDPQCSLRRLVH